MGYGVSCPAGKRQLDVILAGMAISASSPLWVVIAVAVKTSSAGPVFHRAQRCGVGGELFTLYKFRTMRLPSNELGPRITAGADERVTVVGAFLRKWKLDELPQLINVIKGEMSLVGPRPEDPSFVQDYGELEMQILDDRPGITSPASILFRHEQEILGRSNQPETMYRETILPSKLAIDLEYFESNTLYSDFAVLLRTLGTVFRGTPGM